MVGTERTKDGNAVAGADQRWEARVRDGLAAFHAGRVDEAYAAWRSAAAIAREPSPRTTRAGRRAGLISPSAMPRPATTLAGRRAFRRALRAWEAAEGWVARMAVPQRARSSGFHLRLQAKHPGGYDTVARAEFTKLLGAGRAAALTGGAHLARSPAAALEAAQAKRAAGLSWREADQVAIWRALAVLREEAGDGAAALDARQRAEAIERDPGELRAGASRRRSRRARRPSDLRRLEAAVYLTPVVLLRRR